LDEPWDAYRKDPQHTQGFSLGGPSVARGTTYGTVDGPGEPSVAAILGLAGPSTVAKLLYMVRGTICGMTGQMVRNYSNICPSPC